ncbi:MAG: glycosyltransferase family 2 protein [Lysobacterales bacterium]
MKMALCIPAYNAAAFLPRILSDAANQSQPFDEVWVHDDASTDNTAEVARSLGAQVVRSESNVGCSMGKHRLLMETTCERVHFHDADDGLKNTFVAATSQFLRTASRPVDVLLAGFEYRDMRTNELLSELQYDDAQLKQDPIAYTLSQPINAICGVYRTDALRAAGGYQIPDNQLYNEDQAFHCRLAREGLSFAALAQSPVINYRVQGSMSGAAHLACVQAQYEVMAEAARKSAPIYHRLIARRLWQIASSAAAWDDWALADASVLLAASLDPKGPQDGHVTYRWLASHAPRLAIRARRRVIALLGRAPQLGSPP